MWLLNNLIFILTICIWLYDLYLFCANSYTNTPLTWFGVCTMCSMFSSSFSLFSDQCGPHYVGLCYLCLEFLTCCDQKKKRIPNLFSTFRGPHIGRNLNIDLWVEWWKWCYRHITDWFLPFFSFSLLGREHDDE